jgi:ABC-2 type transport system ATP-binding protein
MIRELANGGKTVLISSHILTELAEICDVVGILEKGRLVAVGSVDEIRKQGQTPQNVVEVRLLDGTGNLAQWLEGRSGVGEIRQDGAVVRFLHAGRLDEEADLLKAIVDAGFRVVAFGSRQRSLEDAFMQVTKGLVQ